MTKKSEILQCVDDIYSWLNLQTQVYDNLCSACGKCCDFGAFEHRLFVTTAELMYLTAETRPQKIRPMPTGRCPYNAEGKCTIYRYRFAGCRIFCCKADKEFQSSLSENISLKFKAICERFEIPYRYMDLQTALNETMGGFAVC